MFEYDICLCGNPEKCPLKDICLRNQHRVYFTQKIKIVNIL